MCISTDLKLRRGVLRFESHQKGVCGHRRAPVWSVGGGRGPRKEKESKKSTRDFGKLGEKTRSVSKARGGERLKTTCFW